jgi:hypothetical protein
MYNYPAPSKGYRSTHAHPQEQILEVSDERNRVTSR